MRALTIAAHGGVEQLQYRTDLPVPAITAPTDVRIRVQAAALNRLDLFVLEGIPGVHLTPDFIPGSDATGLIDAVGSAVTGLAPGTRVIVNGGVSDRTCEYCLAGEQSECVRFRMMGEHVSGTFAEYIVVPATNVRAISPTISTPVAAAYTLATLTAWRMLVTKAQVGPRDTVLIWGIGGGVAIAALQIARARGARVWVTSGSDDKLAWAATLGADAGFNHATTDVVEAVRARTGKRGVDVVVDSVGTATWARSLRVLGRGGRLVTCGGTSGPMVETDVRRLFWYQWTLMGSTMGNDREFDAVAEALARGELTPPVDSVYPLSEARAAYQRLASGAQRGKVVLSIGEDS
ncbi:MAG TPA: zinc-binding dehydrogenase [Gemmatimonadaceae bacterium]|jgi:NADPH:quinone reductase-like Zn-dependent oxidoreductase|nr:zinc-binding dehydrogenase [Gemmatimonadaceae bacterium]